MDEEARVKILRFDPSVDKEPKLVTYLVPANGWKGLTLLETIRYVYENIDGGLSFRECCRNRRICSACVVMLNKKVVLACDVLSQKEMIVEPAPNYALIKDLVVDFGHSRHRV